jgi:hypothetical protein
MTVLKEEVLNDRGWVLVLYPSGKGYQVDLLHHDCFAKCWFRFDLGEAHDVFKRAKKYYA